MRDRRRVEVAQVFWLTVALALSCARGGEQVSDAGASCQLDAGALRACVDACDDGDVCTADLCSRDGVCRHVRNCVVPGCRTAACDLSAHCQAGCQASLGPCATGAQATSCSFDSLVCSATTSQKCGLAETCGAGGRCVRAPRSQVLVAVETPGVAQVYATRSEGDDRLVPVDPLNTGRPALAFPDAGLGSRWLVRLDADGGVQHAEPVLTSHLPCLFHDCSGVTGPKPFTSLPTSGVIVRGAERAELKVGYAPPRPAAGTYRVRVVTVHSSGSLPELLSTRTAETPVGCDRDIDAFRNFWPEQAAEWTAGQVALRLEFRDEGTVRVPMPDAGVLSISTQALQLTRLLKQQFPLAERELMLLLVVRPDVALPGLTLPDEGVALVEVTAASFPFLLRTGTHEVGHLFGATDLYPTTVANGFLSCSYARSAELDGPNLYCGADYTRLARLTARELGWVEVDGAPAKAIAPCQQLVSSSFPCDP